MGITLTKSDKYLIAASFFVSCFFGTLIANEDWYRHFFDPRPEGEAVGHAVMTHDEARLRRDRSLSWTDLYDGVPLFQGDSIFTGSQSDATVNLHDVGEILIG